MIYRQARESGPVFCLTDNLVMEEPSAITVGASSARPRGSGYEFPWAGGEYGIFHCRTSDARPYKRSLKRTGECCSGAAAPGWGEIWVCWMGKVGKILVQSPKIAVLPMKCRLSLDKSTKKYYSHTGGLDVPAR